MSLHFRAFVLAASTLLAACSSAVTPGTSDGAASNDAVTGTSSASSDGGGAPGPDTPCPDGDVRIAFVHYPAGPAPQLDAEDHCPSGWIVRHMDFGGWCVPAPEYECHPAPTGCDGGASCMCATTPCPARCELNNCLTSIGQQLTCNCPAP